MKCPTCGRAIAWSAEFPERPFCSERCRLIDLGAWLSGDRAIPGEPVDPDSLPGVAAGPADPAGNPPANPGDAPHGERGR